MHGKNVLYVTDAREPSVVCRRALSALDVQVRTASIAGFRSDNRMRLFDLVIVDTVRDIRMNLADLEEYLFENGPVSLLVVVAVQDLAEFRFPVRVPSDVVAREAVEGEYIARIRHLLWPGEETSLSELVRIDELTVNLATYQVSIDDEPLDFTYLEYALFTFLVTHPGRTYSREALLGRVWGFDYYGGSRTVDVHVRRIRAKLGPEYAQYLETVRGVGYLWNA